MYTRTFFALAIAAAPLTIGSSVAAQSFLLPSTPGKGIWIETAHTSFKEFDASFLSSVSYVSGRLPLTSRISAVADVPFSYAKLDHFADGEQTSSVLGNPYLGLEYAISRRLRVEAGTRAPLNTADSESFADMLAFLADPLRPEAFLEDLVPLSTAATLEQALPAGFAVRARGGVTTLFHTGDVASDTDATVDYGFIGAYAAGRAQLGLGVSGRWYATSGEGSFAKTSLHHAAASADVQLGPVRPGMSLRVPLDSDYRDVVRSSVGVYLQLPLR